MNHEELFTKLIDAIVRESFRDAKKLLEQGANPNLLAASGFKPLHIATEFSHENLVRLLVSHGADINGRTNTGETPLHIAVDIDADSAWQNRREPDTEMTQLMLELGIDPNLKNNDGKTALDWAIDYKHVDAIALLKSRMGLAK